MTRNSDDATVRFTTPYDHEIVVRDGEMTVGCRTEPVGWWLDEDNGDLMLTDDASDLARREEYGRYSIQRVIGRLEAHYDQGDFTLEPPTPDCFVLIVGGKYGRSWDYADTDWFDDNRDPRALVTVEGADDPRDMPGDVICLLDELDDIVRSEIGLDRITPPEPDHAEGRIAGGPAWTTDPEAKSKKGDVWLRFRSESARSKWLEHGGDVEGNPDVYVSKRPTRLGTQQFGDHATVLLRVSEERNDPNVPAGYWRDLGLDPDQTWEHGGRTYKLRDEYPKVPGRQEGPRLGWSPLQDWIVKPDGYLAGPPNEPTNEHPTLGKKRPILEPAP